jgi:hypothetical protein
MREKSQIHSEVLTVFFLDEFFNVTDVAPKGSFGFQFQAGCRGCPDGCL